ncbi:RNA-directed DNA polymerase [Bradyrhizobium jicamae]|uniref:RNA-directed DNA polymerase n=1 Tax=Bradyrhizobium jicamae TaxID=280332 RepID=A0ABS5FB44_9BRAD|nr:RNA-directed DNA polymerase [Bradyrhizobium jicamae]MBR0793998.1 RNA-directed DNA polymerase [Bradyrhizobium jicamae]
MPNIASATIVWSIEHLLSHGDTDIFPYPLEFRFLADRKSEVADELAKQEIGSYRPMSALESLVPKSRYNFRVAHQLFPIDCVLVTSCVREIGDELERSRLPPDQGPFSYRYAPSDTFAFFAEDCRYGDWLRKQYTRLLFAGDEFAHIIEADISEFYQRIYHHRLENTLLVATTNKPAARFLKQFISDVRARQSFGIPVGGNASRLLAEILLNDTDRALVAEGYEFTRYVDDFRLYLKNGQDPYTALAFLSEHLMTNEGLFLASAKTRVHTLGEYLDKLNMSSGEDTAQADESAAQRLLQEIYDSEDSADAVEALKSEDLIGDLKAELNGEFWDVGRIRVLLRCMKLTKAADAAEFIRGHLRELLPFVKDVVLLIEELVRGGSDLFSGLADEIVKLILDPAAQRLSVTRAWLLELFIRGVIPISYEQAKPLFELKETLDTRQVLVLRGQLSDVNFFRQRKTKIDELNPWVQSAFIYGAHCLPSDEYRAWLGTLKGRLSFPLSDLFCKWADKLV